MASRKGEVKLENTHKTLDCIMLIGREVWSQLGNTVTDIVKEGTFVDS